MRDLNYVAIVVSVVVAFVISGAWYAVLGNQLAALNPAYTDPGRTTVWTVFVELARNLVVAVVLAALIHHLGATGLGAGLLWGLTLWVGFPVVLLAGSVFHENVPIALAAIHAGDWLLKLVALSAILALWR